jgi:monothiol glutaredoxin
MHNPKMTDASEQPRIKQISASQLQALRAGAAADGGPPLLLLDVRTEGEREIACIAGARHLTAQLVQELQAFPRDTPLVFQCHHGIRSQAAALHFAALGFTDISNLVGGIEAWSLQVDPSVPRY